MICVHTLRGHCNIICNKKRNPLRKKFLIDYVRDLLTAMNTEITVVTIEHLQGSDIRSSEHHLIDPFDPLDHLDALLLGEDGRSLVLGDLLVGVNAHNYLVAKGFGLSQGIRVPKVHHIIAVGRNDKVQLVELSNELILGKLSSVCRGKEEQVVTLSFDMWRT